MVCGCVGSSDEGAQGAPSEDGHHGACVRVKPKTYAQVVETLRANGFVYVRSSGAHRQFHKPGRVMIVTVPYHGRKALMKVGLLKSIARQSGIPESEF